MKERRETTRQDVCIGTSMLKKRKRKRMVLVQQGPRIPARSILELSRMLHSHHPLFRAPSMVPCSLFLPLPRLFFRVVNMPHSVPSGLIPRKGNRLLQVLHRDGGTDIRGRPFSLTLGFRRGSFFLSLSPSFHTPQDFDTDCEIKSSPKSSK